jgi:hypothetical protein
LRKGRYSSRSPTFDAADGEVVNFRCNGARQRGVVPAALSRPPATAASNRSVPDISADADPATGMAIGMLSTQPGKKPRFFLTTGGGTSQATPLVAGMVAAAQRGAKAPIGFLNPVLYQLAGTTRGAA